MLEIGARPYFMTMLMREYMGYDLTALNEPTPEATTSGVHTLRRVDTGETVEIPYVCANIEQQVFPLESATFDLVIFAEVIEHLTYDPTHALGEIHRVLKEDGYLVISTPNALRWDYLLKMLRGKNYYPPFSGYGTTARHNREFSIDELKDLVGGCGFEILTIESVRDAAYDHPRPWESGIKLLNRLGFWRNRLDVIHLVARRLPTGRRWYPPYLYYDLPAYRRVSDASVTMGVNDQTQIDHASFHALEDWPPTIRWTKARSTVFLRGSGQSLLKMRIFPGGRPEAATGSVVVNGKVVGRFECPQGEWLDGEFPLDAPVTGEVEVSVVVDTVFSPVEDTRELGVALQRIELC